MSQINDADQALDEGDENADLLAGEEVEPEHDLDVESFEEESDDA